MKKRNVLASILAIPAMAVLSSCTNSRIRIPQGDVYKTKIGEVNYKMYSVMFQDMHTGSDILEVSGEGRKRVYTGSFGIDRPEIDFIGNRRFDELSDPAKKVIYIQFLMDMNKALRQKSEDEIRDVLFDKETPQEEIDELKEDYLLMYRLYFEEGNKAKFRELYQERVKEELQKEGLENYLLEK